MPTQKNLLMVALCLPLVLASCNGEGSKVGSTPSSSVAAPLSGSASPTPLPSFSPGYPVWSVYVVTAKPGVSDKDLQDAVSRLGKLAGVTSASFTGKHQLRVEMSLTDLVKRGRPVYDALAKLGVVTTA